MKGQHAAVKNNPYISIRDNTEISSGTRKMKPDDNPNY